MRPNKERANRLIIFLWIYTGAMVLSSISDLMQLFLLKRITTGQYSMAEIEGNDLRQAVIAIAIFLFYIGVAIVFIQWFRRAYFNLHTISKDLSFSEGWAAGAWFVPFLNLGRPFVIMKEMMFVAESKLIRENLVEENDNRRRSVGTWWTLWIIVSILSNINSQIQSKAGSIDTIINTTLFDIVLSLMFIPLTIVTVKMVKHYAELEERLPELKNDNSGNAFRFDDNDLLDTI